MVPELVHGEAADGERLGDHIVARRLQLDVEPLVRVVDQARPDRQHRVPTGMRTRRLDVDGDERLASVAQWGATSSPGPAVTWSM